MSQTVTKGSAPMLSISVNPATNRISTSGYSYDSNGNLTAMPSLTMTYDVENRLVEAVHSVNGTDRYVYDPFNQRVWKQQDPGANLVYFYGVEGTLLATYGDDSDTDYNVYFAGRQVWAEATPAWGGSLVAGTVGTDRLGSVVHRNATANRYFPYGGEPAGTVQNRVKFATYYRDRISTLDFARNRYYSSTIARFTTPDPGPHDPSNPQSWNRYSYAWNDPINYNDRGGALPNRIVFDGGTYDDRPQDYVPNAGFFLASWMRDYPPPADQIGFDLRDYYASRADCFEAAGANLSEAQAGLLAGYGKSWSDLKTGEKASFLNLTAALGDAGLDISGLEITGIRNDRILFASNDAFERAVRAGVSNGTFLNDFLLPLSPAHQGYRDRGGVRQNVANAPLQITFGAAGIDIDIDYWNGVRDAVGMLKHIFGEGLVNAVTNNPPSPYSVGRMLRDRGVNLGHDCQ